MLASDHRSNAAGFAVALPAAAAYLRRSAVMQSARRVAFRPFFSSAPGLAAAIALGVSDVLAKIIIASRCDVLTMLSFRSVIGLVFMSIWLRLGPKPIGNARVRWISIAIGLLFAALIFCLFKAIEFNDVPTAVLTYFIYPLLTGLIASATGLERLRWQGVTCALVAFVGLAIMIGAHPAGLALVGVAYAIGAACCRTGVLIATRAFLIGADARLTTWYSVAAQLAVFLGASLVTRTWMPPQTNVGWAALIALSLATTVGVLFVFVSTIRIGAFRTALLMNVEPLTATVLSALVLSEVMTPLQAFGGATMLVALVAFQLWK
jgi:probable blue pigment (indigoidine) exporter